MSDEVFQKPAQLPDIPHRGVLRPGDFYDDFQFAHYNPPASLARYVAYIWVISWNFPPGVSRQSLAILPSPQINVFFSEDGAGIQSVFRSHRTYRASGRGCVAGITFQPGGFYGFWPHNASRLASEVVSIGNVFAQVDSQYVTELIHLSPDDIHQRLASLLLSRSPMPDPNIAVVQRIVRAIEQDRTLTTVEAVAKHFGKSERALQQLFQRFAGIGVKWVLLRNRVLDATESTREQTTPNWLAIALDLGYSSQAHFITDFKRTIGMTPTEYLRFIR